MTFCLYCAKTGKASGWTCHRRIWSDGCLSGKLHNPCCLVSHLHLCAKLSSKETEELFRFLKPPPAHFGSTHWRIMTRAFFCLELSKSHSRTNTSCCTTRIWCRLLALILTVFWLERWDTVLLYPPSQPSLYWQGGSFHWTALRLDQRYSTKFHKANWRWLRT